jgi:hypothetical protein
MIGEDHTSAEMEALRVRRLWRAFAGEPGPDPPRSALGRGLIASAVLAVLLLLGVFIAGVVGSATEQTGTTTPTAPNVTPTPTATGAAPPPASAPPSTPPPSPPPPDRTVSVASEVEWTDSGIDIGPGDVAQLTATGIVAHNVGDPASEVGPAGDLRPELAAANRVVDGVPLEGPHAALIGRVGDGPVFRIGERAALRFDSARGRLRLGVNDNGLENNDGEFEVTVQVQRPAG